MDPERLSLARRTRGFLPEPEALALHDFATQAAAFGPLLEVGSYCGLSAIHLGDAAAAAGSLLFSVDHHRGSEEHQPGEEYHDEGLVDVEGRLDTLPTFLETIHWAGLDHAVVALVGASSELAVSWTTPLAMVFIDGGHSSEAAHGDFEGWSRWLLPGGLLAIHDVFPDPRDGGRPPFDVYRRALESGGFVEVGAEGSLRVLRLNPPLPGPPRGRQSSRRGTALP